MQGGRDFLSEIIPIHRCFERSRIADELLAAVYDTLLTLPGSVVRADVGLEPSLIRFSAAAEAEPCLSLSFADVAVGFL